jgi:2OG-Fe(II) oxygenase superfamily
MMRGLLPWTVELVIGLVGLQLPLSSLAFQPSIRIKCGHQTASQREQVFKTHASKTSSNDSNKNNGRPRTSSRTRTQTGTGFGAAGPATAKAKAPKPIQVKGNSTLDSNDDFAVFPALEEEVRSTLVPAVGNTSGGTSSSGSDDEAIDMNDEVYGRLDQIYGFPNFNRQSTTSKSSNEKMTGVVSFGDLLSVAEPGGDRRDEGASSILQQSVGILPSFESIRVLHMDPLVLVVDHFFSDEECDRYIALSLEATTVQTRSPTVGKDATAKAQRTSTTFYHMYDRVPELLSKTARLLGIDALDCLEEVQTVRYQRHQRFTWHLDALGPADLALSGQRVATLLVYLTDLAETDGGATLFRDLNLAVRPKKGSALLFFPAAGGIPGTPLDIRTLHCGEAVRGDTTSATTAEKWIAQLWLREEAYRPTVPPGNAHARALTAVEKYCNAQKLVM